MIDIKRTIKLLRMEKGESKMINFDYKVLKQLIRKACKAEKGIDFKVDYDKLVSVVSDLGLEPVCTDMHANKVKPELIPYLSEYFAKSRLSWFNENKYLTVVTFVDVEAIDDTCRDLLDKMKTSQIDDPDIDKVNSYATIVANYPCYFATIVSYQSNDPRRSNRPWYEIICRANKVVIRNPEYQYNPVDFS